MATALQAQQLKENPLLLELLAGWRRELIDAMLVEPDAAKRDLLWHEQSYLERLTERIDVELITIISGRERAD